MKKSGLCIGKRVFSLVLAMIVAGGLAYPRAAEAKIVVLPNPNKPQTDPDKPQTNNLSYTFTWKNWDGTVLQKVSGVKSLSNRPSYSSGTPTRPSDDAYSYTFTGWIESRSGGINIADYNYVAQYEAVPLENGKLEIQWKNENGSLLKREFLNPGTVPSWEGDPPVKESDVNNEYTFSGWSPAPAAVTEAVTYTAQYAASPILYTIQWMNTDGTVLKSAAAGYDNIPEYDGPTPEKNPDAQYTYTFSGWRETVDIAQKLIQYRATYEKTVNTFTITWKNVDGTVLTTETVPFGETPAYTGETPTTADDAYYHYTFSGWAPAVSRVTKDAVYTAHYSAILRSYPITWKNADGTVLSTNEEPAGQVPQYSGATPEKAADVQYTWTFQGWIPEPAAVTGEATYTANYIPTVRNYTVTWKNADGTVLETDESVPAGSLPVYDGETPTKEMDAQYRYQFSGWQPEVSKAAADAEYTAVYTVLPNVYTVKFRDTDGVTGLGIADRTVAYGASVQEPDTVPEKEGYRPAGWNHGDTVFDFSRPLEDPDNTEILLTPRFLKLHPITRAGYIGAGNGTVSFTTEAVAGEEVTVTAHPWENSVSAWVSVSFTENGETISVPCAATGENTYTFIMQDRDDIRITAGFELRDDLLGGLKNTSTGYYEINSAADLLLLRTWMAAGHDMEGETIVLTGDIDITGTGFESFPRSISGTSAAYRFKGTFDGQGHAIRGLQINRESADAGFFYVNDGTIKNLTLSGQVSGGGRYHFVGGIAADNTGTIQNCVSLVRVKGDYNSYNGGIVGYNSGTVSGCLYLGMGGLYGNEAMNATGQNATGEGSASDCTALYAVTGNDSADKGIVTVTRAESDGAVSGYFRAGSNVILTLSAGAREGWTLNGFRYQVYNEATYDYEDVNLTDNGDGTWLLAGIDQDINVLPAYSYDALGSLSQDGSNRYLIRTMVDLLAVAQAVADLDGCSGMSFLLANDLTDIGSFPGIAVGPESYFYGTFDGGGHTISGMNIVSTADRVGFIGNMSGTLTGLTLKDCSVMSTGTYSVVGMLAGNADYGTLSHCRVLGGYVRGAYAGAISGYGATEDNLYSTDVTVVSGGEPKTPGDCGTGDGDYNSNNGACVMWTVKFLSEAGGVAMAAEQHVADTDAASVPAVTILPEREHFTFTGNWQRADGTEYTFDSVWDYNNITSDTVLYAVWEEEEKCEITLADGLESGETETVTVYLSEAAGWTVPACGFIAPEGKKFAGWEYENNLYTEGTVAALTGEGKLLTARWEWIYHTVYAENGELTEEIGNAYFGEEFEFLVKPDDGYETVSVTCTSASGQDVPVTEDTEDRYIYYLTMPNESVTLSATFRIADYLITASGLEHATLLVNETEADPTGDIIAHYDDTITVQPKAGYRLVSLNVKNAALDVVETADGQFSMPAISVTVTAKIEPFFDTPNFTLPAGVGTLGESAFEGDPLITAVDASNCSSIGAYAFKDTGLTQIRLPGTCTIHENAFSGLDQVYVFAPAGGSTEDYCNAHDNLIFVDTEELLHGSTETDGPVYIFPAHSWP